MISGKKGVSKEESFNKLLLNNRTLDDPKLDKFDKETLLGATWNIFSSFSVNINWQVWGPAML